jgi:hypothetical protein
MVDTYTPSLRLTQPEINANNDVWADLLNAGLIALLDDSIAGETVVDVTAGTVVLTRNNGATDEGRMMFIRVIGTPGVNRAVITSVGNDVLSKLYIVTNDSDSTVDFAPSGTAVRVNPGQTTMLYGAPVSANGMVEVDSVGDFVGEVSSGASLGTLTLDILPTPAGGDVTVACEYQFTGSWVFLTFEEFNSTAVPGTTFSVLPQSGNWDVIRPAGDQGLVPFVVKSFPMLLYEDTGGGFVAADSIITVTSNTNQPWQITRVDGAAYTNPSDRQQLRPQTVFYPRQVNS